MKMWKRFLIITRETPFVNVALRRLARAEQCQANRTVQPPMPPMLTRS